MRGRQIAALRPKPTNAPYLRIADYAPIFNNAVKANSHTLGPLEDFDTELKVPFDENFWHSGCLENCGDAISHYLGRVVLLVRPLGRLESRIAIITNGVESSHSGDETIHSSTTDQKDQFLPRGLREVGLNAENALIWPFNLRQSRIFKPDEMSTEMAATEAAYFTDYSFSLIAASSARFILICEGIQERYMFDQAQGLSPTIGITIRGCNVAFRLMLDGNNIQRVFIVMPDPKKLMRGGNWRSAHKFAQIIRLATILTKMEAIDYNFFENNSSCASILRGVVEEKTSGTPLTIQLLDSGLRHWLTRKGFETDEDIEELVKLVGGSLAEGLFVLLCCLPRRYGIGRARLRTKSVVRGPKCSKELFMAVKKLREEKVKKNFNCLNIDEDDHDKVPNVTRISVLRKPSYHGTDTQDRLKERDEELEDDPEESEDKPARMMEFSVDITDELKIEIAEDYETVRYRLEEKGSTFQRPELAVPIIKLGYEARKRRLETSKFRSMYRFADKEKDDSETVKVKCGTCSEEQTDDLPLYDHDGAYVVRQMACSSCKISLPGQKPRPDHFPVDARIKITMYRTGILDAFYKKNPHAEGAKEWRAANERRSTKYAAKLQAQKEASGAIRDTLVD